MRYFIERFQGTPEGSQSTREATLSGAMRGILRSGRRGALKRDFVFASLFRNCFIKIPPCKKCYAKIRLLCYNILSEVFTLAYWWCWSGCQYGEKEEFL